MRQSKKSLEVYLAMTLDYIRPYDKQIKYEKIGYIVLVEIQALSYTHHGDVWVS